MRSSKVKASSPRTQLWQEGTDLDGNSVEIRISSSELACDYTPAPTEALAQECWCLGGGHTADPAPGFTPDWGALWASQDLGLIYLCSDTFMSENGGRISWDWSPGSQALLVGSVKHCGERASPGLT